MLMVDVDAQLRSAAGFQLACGPVLDREELRVPLQGRSGEGLPQGKGRQVRGEVI